MDRFAQGEPFSVIIAGEVGRFSIGHTSRLIELVRLQKTASAALQRAGKFRQTLSSLTICAKWVTHMDNLNGTIVGVRGDSNATQ